MAPLAEDEEQRRLGRGEHVVKTRERLHRQEACRCATLYYVFLTQHLIVPHACNSAQLNLEFILKVPS